MLVLGLWIVPSIALIGQDQPEKAEKAAPAKIKLPEADQLELAHALEVKINSNDTKGFNELIDWSFIVDSATSGAKKASLEKVRKEFKRGFLKEINGANNLSSQLAVAVQQGGTFKFLRLVEVEETPATLFRLKMPNQGVNYLYFFPHRSEDGVVRASDLYIFASSERTSETVRRLWLPLAAESSKDLIQRFTQPMDPLLTAIQSIPKMQQYVRDGKGEKTLAIYQSLPEKAQQEKVFLLIRLTAAISVSEEEHAKAIEDFRKYHPNDPALDFLLIDGYVLKMNFEQALVCIDQTNKKVGGDSSLLAMRANVLAKLDRFEEALKAINESINLEPELVENYFIALEISVAAKNDDETLKLLTKVETDFDIKFDDLTKIPVYADFVKSSQYKKWIKDK